MVLQMPDLELAEIFYHISLVGGPPLPKGMLDKDLEILTCRVWSCSLGRQSLFSEDQSLSKANHRSRDTNSPIFYKGRLGRRDGVQKTEKGYDDPEHDQGKVELLQHFCSNHYCKSQAGKRQVSHLKC